MNSYQVDLRCPNRGRVHRVSNDLRLDHGPSQPGTLDDLYRGAGLPQTLANLFHDPVWCDQSAAYIQLRDPSVIAPMMLDQAKKETRFLSKTWFLNHW